MSSVKIQGSATGTAAFTIAVPDGTSTDRTIELPDAAGSFVLADASGNVGINTTTPDEALNIGFSGADDVNAIRIEGSNGSSQRYAFDIVADGGNSRTDFKIGTVGNTPTTKMTLNGSGRLLLDGTTDAGYGPLQMGNTSSSQSIIQMLASTTGANSIHFGDATSGSDRYTGYINYAHDSNSLQFATNGGVERARIDSSGNVLSGRTSVGVYSNSAGVTIDPGGSIYCERQGTTMSLNRFLGNGSILDCRRDGGVVGSISVTTTSTSYNTSSDYRLKENVVDLDGAIDRVKQVPVHRFNFIADPDKTVDGFLAHEVADVVPEAISGEKDAMKTEEYEVTPAVLDDDGKVVTEAVMGTREVPDYQGIDQSKLVPLLTQALKDAITKIEALETRVAALEAV